MTSSNAGSLCRWRCARPEPTPSSLLPRWRAFCFTLLFRKWSWITSRYPALPRGPFAAGGERLNISVSFNNIVGWESGAEEYVLSNSVMSRCTCCTATPRVAAFFWLTCFYKTRWANCHLFILNPAYFNLISCSLHMQERLWWNVTEYIYSTTVCSVNLNNNFLYWLRKCSLPEAK